MLWFNVEKGYGYIRTEHDERLYVARSGFVSDHEPEGRCKGRRVDFERQVSGDEPSAVNVAFVADANPGRARLRHSRGGRGL
jgi:cold shock CspA family protein